MFLHYATFFSHFCNIFLRFTVKKTVFVGVLSVTSLVIFLSCGSDYSFLYNCGEALRLVGTVSIQM